MDDLKMLTQEEVAEILHANIMTITMLREIGIIPAIKTGRNYMFAKEDVKSFQKEYKGLDVSNKVKALESYRLVNNRMPV